MSTDDEALERRIVTVLFADLVGFTPLAERLDAEDVAAIQDGYFALARDTVGRYGGRVDKYIGDAVMAVFGVPRSRDDDVERAVRTGLALIHGVQQLNAELGLDEDVLLLRVGVNTGETVLAIDGSNEGRVTGDAVNTAQRLQAEAPGGGMLVGESTALAIADIAELGEQVSLKLKGKRRPTKGRTVIGLLPQPSREQAMGALRAPTIGRETELATLDDALQRVAGGPANGSGVAERWLIVAPPGVGKSRLLRELAERANARPAVVIWRARSRPGAVSVFDAIAGLFASALGADNATREQAQDRLQSALVAAGHPPSRVAVVAQSCAALVWPADAGVDAGPGGPQPNDDRGVLFGAWLDGLDALAGDATQLWLVEDIHWAGGDILAFLNLAGSRPTAHGRLVVATARPALLAEPSQWGVDRPDEGKRALRLDTLDATDARGLISALVGDALPADLVERIVERSDGNCLFIEELLRTWVSVGTLVRDADDHDVHRWRLDVPADEVTLPHSVQQMYAAQLDDLPTDARRLARRASVAGRRFALRALEPLGLDDHGLEPLRRRELVSGPVAEPIVGDAFAYRHALLRDAGYASLGRAERARLHVRLARWLEAAAGQRSAEVAEQIATHYAAALDSAPALAVTLDDDLDRAQVRNLAAEWFEHAGQSALTLSAQDAARQLLQRSIEMTAGGATLDLARRWEHLADATAFAADMSEGGRAYELAIGFYRAALQSDRSAAAAEGLARATASLADVWYQQLRFAESRDLADRTLAALPDADPGSRARLLIARGNGSLGADGASTVVAEDLKSAVALASQTDDLALRLLARKAWTGYRSEAGAFNARDWLEIAAQAAALNQARTAISASMNAVGSIDDEPRDISRPIAQAREMAIAHGLTEELGWISFAEAEEAFVAGDWSRALELGTSVMDVGEANEYLRLTVRTIHVVVPIAAARGDLGLLERAARWYSSLEGRFEFPDSPYSRVVRPAQDLDVAAAGLRAAYVPDVEPRLAAFNDDPSGPSWSSALDRVLRSWVEAGELDGADHALDAMAAFIAKNASVSNLGLGTYSLMRGRVALARGDHAGAVTAGSEALTHFRISNAPWWKAKAFRLIQRAGAADSALVAKVEQIEHLLGASGPTP